MMYNINMVKLSKKTLFIVVPTVLAVLVIGFLVVSIILGRRTDLVYTGNVYSHNTKSSTQGLFFDDNGVLYETGGNYGESAIYKNVNLSSGTAEKTKMVAESLFLEGATQYKGKIYILTYKESKVLVYNKDLNFEKEMYYPRDGWGLTTNGKSLIASDGSANLYFLDENLKTEKIINVTDERGSPVVYLNELEFINGLIFANVWRTDKIVAIDPNSGNVVKTFDLADLYPVKEHGVENVMNGIAFNKKTNKVYITGKNWPKMFEFELK